MSEPKEHKQNINLGRVLIKAQTSAYAVEQIDQSIAGFDAVDGSSAGT
jgi:hypothetical protein